MRTSTKAIMAFAMCLAFSSASIFDVDFEQTDSDVNLEVKKGDLMRVNLKENPSTGYVWRFQAPQQNKLGIYSVQMDDFTEPKSDSGVDGESDGDMPEGLSMTGVAGRRTVVLRADKEGRDEFELVLVRSWEYKDFIESKAGEAIKMKDVPNAGYRKLVFTVKE